MNKRKLLGYITSDKMDKTRIVLVSSQKKDSKYGKYIKISNKFKAHDEKNEFKSGDEVVIEESRPYSKEKRWRIVKAVKKTDENPVEKPESEEITN